MKNINLKIVFLLIALIFNKVYAINSDTLGIKKIEPPFLYADTNIITIENDSILFKGYLVFKFCKNGIYPKSFAKNYITIESFFLKDLNDLENTKKYFYFFTNHYYYISYVSRDNIDKKLDTNERTLKFLKFINSSDFISFKKLYLKYYPLEDRENNNFLKNSISANIFFDKNSKFLSLLNNDSTGYFVFNCSFLTSILNLQASFRIFSENGEINFQKDLGCIKVILPISQLYNFDSLNKNVYKKYGFKKAKWFPEILKN